MQQNIQKNVRELGFWLHDSFLNLERAFQTLEGQPASQRALIRNHGETGRSPEDMTCADWWDKSKHLKKKTVGQEYVLSFPFISERVERGFADSNFKKSAWSQKCEEYSLSARFYSAAAWPFMVITIIISCNNSSNCREVKDSSTRQTWRKEGGTGRPSLLLTSVESLQLLKIKLQTGSFIPRRVQLILQLDFKEAAVLLCGAAPRQPRPQLAAAAKPIKSPPTGHTGRPRSRN